MGSYKMFGCFTRKFKSIEASPQQDALAAFHKYAEGGPHMSAEQLLRFLLEAQGGNAAAAAASSSSSAEGYRGGGAELLTIADAQMIVGQVLQKLHPISKFARHHLTLDDFLRFLFSPDLNPPIGNQVHQDMKKPLSHYFIFTGHNSYLTGNQLSSDSSDVPIIKALKKGVRGIELDLWPNDDDDNIDVKHGGTLTTPVELNVCLKSIKEHAFVASPYPVIITFEDHLTPNLQAKVAEMVTGTFGDILFTPGCDCLEEFPSPEDLKYRILISTKPPKEYLKSDAAEGNKSRKDKDSDEEVWGKEPSVHTSKQEVDDLSDSDSEDSEDEPKQGEVSEYKRLIAIHAGKPKGGLKEHLKVDPKKVRRLSLSESAIEKASAKYGMDLVRFTQKNILRVYPKGTRITSSNYKPLIAWMHGAQMVAFNMQGYGKALWLMHGMFKSNGGCGYVKKMYFLMNAGPHGEVFNPKTELPIKMTLKVKVYMGDGWNIDFKPTHFDSYSPPDFYTRVGIAGVPADTVMEKTKTIEDNWTPVWDEEFEFPLTVPELALLRIEVHEYDMSVEDDFAGQNCLPVSELRQGIRAVSLFDRKGVQYSSARLLMRFEFV